MNKDNRDKALYRITTIATRLLLQGGGQLDAQELSQEFNVSLRTLRRDVANMGAPFSYERDKISLDMQNSGEMVDSALAIAYIKSFAQNSGEAMRSAIYALLKRLEISSGDHGAFFTRNSLEEIELDLESLRILQECIRQGRCVEFIFPKYAPKHVKPRLVQPLKIIAFEGQWYLLGEEKEARESSGVRESSDTTSAADSAPSAEPAGRTSAAESSTEFRDSTPAQESPKSRQKPESSQDSTPPQMPQKPPPKAPKPDPKAHGIIKKFYLNNIKFVRRAGRGRVIESDEFKRLDSALNAWFQPSGERIEVVLWVDSKVAKYFRRRKLSPLQHVRQCGDGSLEVSLPVTDYMEISGEILRWIPYVFVLEPKGLQEFIRERVVRYLAKLD